MWSDEFDYTGLPDSSRWSYDVGGHGWGNGEEQFYTQGRMQNARVAFHTYSVEWTPEEIRAYVDTMHYYTFKNQRFGSKQTNFRQWPFDRPFHLILNVAVGGMWGGAQGIDHAIWPQKMEVDYVRVYDVDDGTAVESQSWGQVKTDER